MYCKIGVGVLAAIVIAAFAWLLIRRKKMAGKGGKVVNITLAGVSALLLAVIIVANAVTSIYAGSINAVFTKAGTNMGTSETNMEDWKGLVTEIADEGMVLMKNEDHTLPLEKGSKINLLGYCAYNPVFSGSGSGSVAAADFITIEQALKDAGFEINRAPMDEQIYPYVEVEGKSLGFFTMNLSIDEPSLTTYTGSASFENMKQFSDTAVVVLGRSGGEGYDLTAYEVVTVEATVEDFASYDSTYDNGDGSLGCYMLDQGEYIFSVRSDAHTMVDEVTAKLDGDYFYSGGNKRASDDQQRMISLQMLHVVNIFPDRMDSQITSLQ